MKPWIHRLWFCLLLGAASAFPLHQKPYHSIDSARNGPVLMMSLPSTRGFRPLQKKKATKAKELWYRDRSSAEEQMTTQTTTVAATLPNAASLEQSTATNELRHTTASTTNEDWNLFGAVNRPMVQATCLSHATLLVVGWIVLSVAMMGAGHPYDYHLLHWNGDIAPYHSFLDWTPTPWRLLQGIVATVPLVGLSSMIGNSDELFCPIHFSITNTVLSLFGRRGDNAAQGTNIFAVLLCSLGIGSVSALSEELIFRGLLPTALVAYTHSVELALLCQALLFGIGQIRHKSSIAENGVYSLMQSMNGLWYGLVYLGTGGDILPVLVAHVLYECHVFVGAWKMINDQLDYTEERTSATREDLLSPGEQKELNTIQEETGGRLKPEILASCRRVFYAFDYDHQGSLSRADVKRAVVYAFQQEDAVNQPSDAKTNAMFDQIIAARRRPPAQTSQEEEDEEDRLTLSEFLHLLFALKTKHWNNQQLA